MTDASTAPAVYADAAVDSPPSTASGFAALGGAEIAGRIIAFGTAALLARRLGPELFGVLGFAAAICGYFAVFIGGGLNDLGARDVARRRGAAAAIYRGLVGVRLPLALGALALLILLAFSLRRPAEHRLLVSLTGLSLLSLAIDPLWVFRALQRAWLAAGAGVAMQLLVLAAVFALVTGPDDAVRVPVVQFVIDTGIAAALVAVLWRTSDRTASADGVALLRESAPLLFGRGMRTIIVSFDMVLLGFVATAADVGVYAAVYRLHFFILALIVALQSAYLPVMARAATHGPAALDTTVVNALGGAAILGAPLVAGGLIVAGPLLGFLFGPPYDQGARALQWLLISLALAFVHGMLHNVYVVTRRTNLEGRWFALGAAVNIAANLWLIPRYGIAGAASATALAEAVIAVGAMFVSRIARPMVVARAWASPALAAALMAAVVWLTQNVLPLPALLALGAVVYTAAVFALVGRSTAARRLAL